MAIKPTTSVPGKPKAAPKAMPKAEVPKKADPEPSPVTPSGTQVAPGVYVTARDKGSVVSVSKTAERTASAGATAYAQASAAKSTGTTATVSPPLSPPVPALLKPPTQKTASSVPALPNVLHTSLLPALSKPATFSTGPVPGSSFEVARGVRLTTDESGKQTVDARVPKEDRFKWGLLTADGKKVSSERVTILTNGAGAGSKAVTSTSFGSKAWAEGASSYIGSRQALQGDRDYLAKVVEQARIGSTRADFTPEQKKLAADQLTWAQGQIAAIDKSLQSTRIDSARAPDLLLPEKVERGVTPTEARVVTNTEAKLTILDRARTGAPEVGSDPQYINDPMRTLARQDPITYAARSLELEHAGDAQWLGAITESMPPARREFTEARVKEELDKGNVKGALQVLKTNLDATSGEPERKQLFDAAGKNSFTQGFVNDGLDKAIAERGLGARRDDPVAKVLSEYGTYAPPEVAKLEVAAVESRLSQPGSKLVDQLREDGAGGGNGNIYVGLSLVTQRADENGGTASRDMGGILLRQVYGDRRGLDVYGSQSAVISGFASGVRQATAAGAPSLSLALINQIHGDPSDRLDQLGDVARGSLVSGIKDLGKRLSDDSDAYVKADQQAINLRNLYGPAMGNERVAQAILRDRLLHPEDADKADAAYATVQANGVAIQRLLDGLGGLDPSLAEDKNLVAALVALDKDPTARFSLAAAAGANADRPTSAYDAPLLAYLKNQMELGLSSASAPGAAAAPLPTSNENRTLLQAVGNQTSIYRHVLGLYSVSGEALLSARSVSWLLKAGGAALMDGSAEERVRRSLDKIDPVKLERWSELLHADKGLGTQLLGVMKEHLPRMAGALQSRDGAAFRAAFSDLVKKYPNLGAGYENLDPSKDSQAVTIRGIRALFALTSAINNGVNATNSSGLDQLSDAAFAGTLGLFGADAGVKTSKDVRNVGVPGGSNDGFIKKAILQGQSADDLGKLRFAAKTVADVMPGELISAADLVWLGAEVLSPNSALNKTGDPTKALLVGGIVVSNTIGLAEEVAQVYARRAVSQAAAQGVAMSAGASGFALARALTALAPVGAAGNILFGSAYFLKSYLDAKSTMEFGENPRYAEMVGEVTGLQPDRAKAVMDQSGGAFSSPNPMPGWVMGFPVVGAWASALAPKIVTGGVQPIDVLAQWSKTRPGKEGALQAYLPTQNKEALQSLAHITGDIADHYIPRGSSEVSKEGLVELEKRMKERGLWHPTLDRPRAVQDVPVAGPAKAGH